MILMLQLRQMLMEGTTGIYVVETTGTEDISTMQRPDSKEPSGSHLERNWK
jgi:hypothetical protein